MSYSLLNSIVGVVSLYLSQVSFHRLKISLEKWIPMSDLVGGTEGVGAAQVIAYSTSRMTTDFREAP